MDSLCWRLVSLRGRVGMAIRIAFLVLFAAIAVSEVNAELKAKGAAAQDPIATIALPPDVVRAQEVLLPFKRSLKETLVAGMEAGPAEVIRSCNLQAAAIAEASREGIHVGRSSDRLRNPQNAPEDWMKPLIKALAAEEKGAPPRWTELSDGRFGYVEPIYTQALCITCHGSEITPELQVLLDELYPADRATGYGLDEFRGIFWVVLDPGARATMQRD